MESRWPVRHVNGFWRLRHTDRLSMSISALRIGRTVAWACIVGIAVLSLLPADDLVRTALGGHAEHIVAYATTALIVSAVYRNLTPLQVFAALTTYAACLEYLQRFSPGRNSSVVDFAFGAVGIAIGAAIFVIGKKLSRAVIERV